MLEKLNAKRQGQMISQPFIVKKMNTFPSETIHIMFRCAMHLHGNLNKVVPFMKPSILVDLRNGVKFYSCTCCSINDAVVGIIIHRVKWTVWFRSMLFA
jgi:hypothetical protein